MKEYETLASLTSSRQANTGLMIYCRENLRYYIVQPEGYSPAVNDITFANSRIGKVVNIADAAFIKTAGGNVQADLDSIIAGGLPSQAGNAGRVLSTDGTNAFWSSISERAVTPEDFGAAGDGVTDDTAAIQAAIDSVKGSSSIGLPTGYVYLSAKTYMHTGLVIDRAVAIVGADRNASRLKCLTTTNPAVIIRLGFDVSNYQAAGRPGPTVAIKGVMIESDKSFASTNRGIEVQTPVSNAIRGWVYLEDTDIHAMGGDAIYGASWEGAIKALNCKFINNGGKQINATSCADWQFVGCEFGVTPDDNILLSGCAAFTFTSCNIYSSTGDLVTMFTDAAATAPVNHQFVSCSFDRSSEGHGIVYNVRNSGNVTFTNCYWTYNGQGAPETYSDIWIDSSVVRGPTIIGGWMQSAADSDSLYNIFFNGALSSCYTTGVQFEAGNARSANVTNAIAQLKFEGAENFASTADMQACTWCDSEDEAENRERANAQYILAPSGYSAKDGDVVAANGRVWALQCDGKWNVKWFGAVGDGVVDDTSAINKAFFRVHDEDTGDQQFYGGILYFPAGSYKLSSTITWRRMSVEGDGSFQTAIVWYGAEGGTMFLKEQPNTFMKGIRLNARQDSAQLSYRPGVIIDASTTAVDPAGTAIDWGYAFHDVYFGKCNDTSLKTGRIVNAYFNRVRFDNSPCLVHVISDGLASLNRVLSFEDCTVDYSQSTGLNIGVDCLFRFTHGSSDYTTLHLENWRFEGEEAFMNNDYFIELNDIDGTTNRLRSRPLSIVMKNIGFSVKEGAAANMNLIGINTTRTGAISIPVQFENFYQNGGIKKLFTAASEPALSSAQINPDIPLTMGLWSIWPSVSGDADLPVNIGGSALFSNGVDFYTKSTLSGDPLSESDILEIASGAIDVSGRSGLLAIDTEAAAASDELATINGGVGNKEIVLHTVDNGRDVVIKNGTGNIQLANTGSDITLTARDKTIRLVYSRTIGRWLEA